MLCAGGEGGNKCFGDTGGPLICNENGKAVIAGVVSFGSCELDNIPGVYARTTAALNWIEANLAKQGLKTHC